MEAIREALLNTLIHRDYQSPTDVRIKIFDKKITFFNPGGLYGKITEEELKTNIYQASTRNKQIAEAFYLTGDIEKYGSGFMRMRDAVKEYPTMMFEFRNSLQGFVTEFSYEEQRINVEMINEGLKILLELIRKKEGLQAKDISEELDRPIKTIERQIAELIKKGLIERRGSRKTGGYFIVEN